MLNTVESNIVDKVVHGYVNAVTAEEQREALALIPLRFQNYYVWNMLDTLRVQHESLQFPAYNRNFASFMKAMKFAFQYNEKPRGFIF